MRLASLQLELQTKQFGYGSYWLCPFVVAVADILGTSKLSNPKVTKLGHRVFTLTILQS
jgi:hypothetical protein